MIDNLGIDIREIVLQGATAGTALELDNGEQGQEQQIQAGDPGEQIIEGIAIGITLIRLRCHLSVGHAYLYALKLVISSQEHFAHIGIVAG